MFVCSDLMIFESTSIYSIKLWFASSLPCWECLWPLYCPSLFDFRYLINPWYLQFVLIFYIIGTSCIGIGYLITHFWVSIDICGLKQRIVLNHNLINKGWWKQTVTVNNSTNIKKSNNQLSLLFFFLACFAASTKN